MSALLLLALAASTPDLRSLPTERFVVHATSRAEPTAALLVRTLESERTGLADRLGRDYPGRTEAFLGEGLDEVRAIAPPGLAPPLWAAGLAVPSQNVLLLDARVLRGPEGRHVLRHELAHLALGRMGGRWPRWFQEGFAMLVAGEWTVAGYAAMYGAVTREALIPFAALAEDWPDGRAQVETAYAQSFSFVSHLYEAGGEPRFRQLVSAVAAGRRFEEALAETYGRPLEDVEADWRGRLAARYRWIPLVTLDRLLWSGIVLLFLAAALLVRRRRRARLALMELEEQAQEAAARILAAERARAAAAAVEEGDDDDEPPTGPGHLLN